MDTIAAIATATGGAIAIVRLSGPEAIAIADGMFRHSGAPLRDKEGYTISYGHIADPSGAMVDEVLVSLFRAPRSYTGEDMVEISAHASPYICRRILSLTLEAGARLAEPGEFTIRAFLAGKMDLAQAEAVADMIACSDRASHAIAANQLRGGFSGELAALRGELLRLAALLELELDFSEEDVTFADRGELDALMQRLEGHIAALAASFSLGNAIKEGVPVAIAGEPNVGKSTLLNALLREERAMVSDIPGTTRDVIEEVLNIDGIRFRFLDTAGMRETQDPLERMGIERTHSSIARARIVLWMADAADFLARPEKYARPPFEVTGEQTVHLLLNKADRLCAEESARAKSLDGVTPLSAKTGDNVMAVTTLLSSTLADAGNGGESTIITSERHHEALRHAATAITRARRALRDGLTADLLAEELRGSLHHLGTITGEITTDEVLGEIFSKFCIGK